MAELGHFALALATALAVAQAILPLLGARLGEVRGAALMQAGPAAAFGLLLCVAVAFASLMHAYATSDFSVVNVVENSHSLKPMLYKLTGTWGNHEGSMLLWVLMLAGCGAAVAAFGRNLPAVLRADVLSVLGMIAAGFLLFTLLTSNPFQRVFPPPLEGRDLNPLLQDPGLALHPPFLYAGYVGFSVAFAFASAALIEGRVDAAWGRWVRPWVLAAWLLLTLGIALGSWWAYYELGWGGYWFWDPVENASFMPWLLGTALLHSAIVVEKREALKVWTILLAILCFSLSLIGTFLVRSGVLNSVHAFATDPARGVFILGLLVVAIGGSLALFAWRAPALTPKGFFAPVSREGALLLNNLFLASACAAVAIGTLYPIFADLLLGARITVGPAFFNSTFLPMMAPLVLVLPAGAMLPWKRADLGGALQRLRLAAALAAIVLVGGLVLSGQAVLPVLGLAAATWIAAGSLIEIAGRARWSLARLLRLPGAAIGMSIAHLGLAVSIAGISGMGFATEGIALLRPGETIEVGGTTIRFEGITRAQGPNYTAERAQLAVINPDRSVRFAMHPEKRFFPSQRMSTTEAAIETNLLRDLYAVLGDVVPERNAAVIRVHVNPLAPWIWLGAVVMALGGLTSLADRRHRVGAPSRRRPAQAAAASGVAAE
ncbi:MAG: heme lyase CcmF/NrfE family subunit [Acetobacteraceae bacterium]|nr:heme lyase CcmF/NrfE family subunit [Acetobacteraceae bacterium]